MGDRRFRPADDKQTSRQINRQADKNINRQAGRQAGKIQICTIVIYLDPTYRLSVAQSTEKKQTQKKDDALRNTK